MAYEIRSDFRAALDIMCAMNDPELDDDGKASVLLGILYPAWKEIPIEHWEETLRKGIEFLDCNQQDDGKRHPKLIDWEQDAGLIIPAVNKVAHGEVRAMPYLHWWTFFAYFMEVDESQLASVIHIRQKKAKHKKLEKWEQEFYRENKAIIDFKSKESEETKKEKQNIMKWL